MRIEIGKGADNRIIVSTPQQVETINGMRTVYRDADGNEFVSGEVRTDYWYPLSSVAGHYDKPHLIDACGTASCGDSTYTRGGNGKWLLLGALVGVLWTLAAFPFRLAGFASKHGGF